MASRRNVQLSIDDETAAGRPLLFLPRLCRHKSPPLEMGMPGELSIHVCGSGDAESLAGLAQIAETIYHDSVQDPVNNGRPVTPRLLTIRDGELAFFEA